MPTGKATTIAERIPSSPFNLFEALRDEWHHGVPIRIVDDMPEDVSGEIADGDSESDSDHPDEWRDIRDDSTREDVDD